MTSPFDKLAKPLGERARAPQFPQRRAPVVKKKGGKIKRKLPGYFFGGLFQGTPAQTTTNTNQTTSNSTTDGDYNDLRHVVLQNASRMTQDALGKGLPQYTGPGVVGQNADQLQAAQQVRNNEGNWQPAFNQAQGDINNSRTFNPFASGNGYVQQAAGMQTGTEAASPFVNQASEQFPDAVQRYMSPYTDSVVNRIADLGARNLNEKLLPGINDTFTGGDAAQFGRERHADIAGRAVRDTQESVLGQQAQALEQGYTTAGNLFNADANRAAGLAGTTGALANSDIVTHAGLGTTAGNLSNLSGNLALNQGAAQQGLGQATQTAAGKDAAALQSVGDAAQQNSQAKETFNYQQWQAQNPFTNPWQAMQAGQSLGSGWQIPSMSNTQGTSTQTQQAAQGSPFGQIMGAGMSLASLAIPGAGGASALGNIFGGGAAAGSGVQVADGGYIRRAAGGMIPTISQIRKRTMRQPPMQPGMPPAGMPGMPPMAPPNPQMQQPNGQMPRSPFAHGGRVWDKSPNDWKLRRGPVDVRFATGGNVEGSRADSANIDRQIYDNVLPSSADWHWSKPFYREKINRMIGPPQYAGGGYADSPFLRASEGLEDRLARPRPFDPARDRYSDMSQPTGREAQYGWGPKDVLARMFDSLPQGVRDNIEFVRDQMPDRTLGYAVDELRNLGGSLRDRDPLGAADHTGMAILNAAGTMIPGMRGASAMTPFARNLVSRMVR